MKRSASILLFLFYCLLISSQEIIYLDENMANITSKQFDEKCTNSVLKCLKFKTDSLTIHKVVYKYNFGKVDNLLYSQIKNQFAEKTNRNIHDNAVLLVRYRDSLFDFKTRNKNHLRHLKQHKSAKHVDFNKLKFQKSREKWIQKQQKCRKKMQKINAETFYVFKYDFGASEQYPTIDWIKDNGLFKKEFFKILYNNNFLILKPTGEYFLSGAHLSNTFLKKLIKNEDWTSFKDDWQKSYQSKSDRGHGVFKTSFYHKKHCF